MKKSRAVKNRSLLAAQEHVYMPNIGPITIFAQANNVTKGKILKSYSPHHYWGKWDLPMSIDNYVSEIKIFLFRLSQ